MNIYKLSQNKATGYDTFSDMVVVASTADDARQMHPRNEWNARDEDGDLIGLLEWAELPSEVFVQHIGVSNTGVLPQVICRSYHAG